MADWPLAQGDGQHWDASALTSSTYGVFPIAAGTINTKGTWVELTPATSFTVAGFYLQVTANDNNADYLLDIGLGADGSEVVLLPNFSVGPMTGNHTGVGAYFPVRIGKGKRMTVRQQCSVAGSGLRVHVLFCSTGFTADPGFNRITTYGVDASAGSQGDDLEPGGTANTKGSWITLTNGSSINRMRSMVITAGIRNLAATTCWWRVDVGIGATPTIILPDLVMNVNAASDMLAQGAYGPFPVDIPAGVALKARAQCSITDATDRLIRSFIIHGID